MLLLLALFTLVVIARAHGGDVEFMREAAGTVFSLWVPAKE